MNALRQLEQAVLEEGREWTRRRWEQQLQAQSNALPARCPQTNQGLKNTRWRDLRLDSVVGPVSLRVRHGYSPALGRWVCPAREAWGLPAYQRLSPEFQARLTYTATDTGSYEGAARLAANWGSPISDGCIHEPRQRLGEAAPTLALPTPGPTPGEPEFSLVIMPDGWMARERGPDWGASRRRKKPQRIAGHEIKSAVIYRLEQRAQNAGGRGLLIEKSVVASPRKPRRWTSGPPFRPRRGGAGWAGPKWSSW